MAHLQVDYSINLEGRLDIAGLCRALRDAAADTGIFPVAGLRVRAFPAAYCVIADGDARHGYVDISVRMGAGRDPAQKQAAADAIFAAARKSCATLIETTPFMLSLEVREIDPELSRKASSIRTYLPEEMH